MLSSVAFRSPTPSDAQRAAKRPALAHDEGAAGIEGDATLAQLTALVSSQAQALDALTAQVSTMAGSMAQLLPTVQQLPAAAAAASAAQQAANASPEAPGVSHLTAKSKELIDAAISSSANRLRAINHAKHAAAEARKGMAQFEPDKIDQLC